MANIPIRKEEKKRYKTYNLLTINDIKQTLSTGSAQVLKKKVQFLSIYKFSSC